MIYVAIRFLHAFNIIGGLTGEGRLSYATFEASLDGQRYHFHTPVEHKRVGPLPVSNEKLVKYLVQNPYNGVEPCDMGKRCPHAELATSGANPDYTFDELPLGAKLVLDELPMDL